MYSLTKCLGQGIPKYQDYHPDTRGGPNKYGGYCPGCNTIYLDLKIMITISMIY